MQQSTNSTLVWVPHESQVWKKAQVIQKITDSQVEVRLVADGDEYDPEDGIVKTVDVREIAKLAGEVSATAMPICNTFNKFGVPDMCTLNHLHEPAVLKNLQLRHCLNIPYTYTGQICIAVNPYQWLDLYRQDLYDKYLELPRNDLSPHPFALSSSAYIDMQENGIEQSILVSGESGAGKTETVKIMMNHLASISGGGDDGSLVIEQVLKSNPLLEAFGNAKTKRNDNSSRFGKFAQLQFNKEGLLVGARCETYLLEKSRVVGQTIGERNYHIFYQVFSLPHEVKKILALDGSVGDYKYVQVGEGSKVDNIEDSEYLQETKDAMDTIGIDYREQQGIFEVVSAILNLGEISFKAESSETSSVLSLDRLESVAGLLQTESTALKTILTNRTMAARGETFTIPLSADQAADLRDAFAKGIYSQLFDWLVARVNNAICSTRSVKHHIGLLDIFGFESFDHNGFEQLCINYANEKLQQKFNSDIFKTVQTEYIQEGIPLELVSFEDNQPILDLIEGRMGLIDLLNETGVLAKATDTAFVGKIHEAFSSHKNFEKVRMNAMQFKIRHYAGDVIYSGDNFLDKNKDTLPPDMLDVLGGSKSPFIRDIFLDSNKTNDKSKPGRRQGFLVGATIANSFRKQLGELMEQIAKTTTQYVRCIKPNANKSPKEFDRQMVVDQLRCAGVIAAIRISRAAFPNRLTLAEFARRFDVICPSKLRKAAPEAMVLGLLEKLGITESSSQNAKFAIGKSKVYFSSGLLQYLEEQRIVVLRKQAILIQANMRAYVKRKQFLAIQKSTLLIQRHTRGWEARRRWRKITNGMPKLQAAIRGFIQRRKFQILILQYREQNRLRLLAEAQAASAQSEAEAREAAAREAAAKEAAARAVPPPPPSQPIQSIGSPYFNGEIPDSPKKSYPTSMISLEMRENMASKVEEAQAMAEQARQAAKEAMQLNAALQVENEQLKAKLSKNARDYADEELRIENERLRSQLAVLQSKIIRADEVALISAKVVDSRITYRDGKQFVEYKLQIETNNRGTLFVWHRYSTFRNLATTLQTKNGYARKEIPELPNKTLFGNFSDKIVQERIEKLNTFLEAATNADYLQWGIRIDAETCVYKRRVKGSSSRDSIASVSRDTMSTMTSSVLSPTNSESSATSTTDSSFRRSFFSRSKQLILPPQTHLVTFDLAVMEIIPRTNISWTSTTNISMSSTPTKEQGDHTIQVLDPEILEINLETNSFDLNIIDTKNSKKIETLIVAEPGSPAAKAIDITNQFDGKNNIRSSKSTKKPEGNEIDDQHDQYTLTYGMMIGILNSAGSMNMFKQRLTMNDFMRVDKKEFPANPRTKLAHSFKFKDYSPDIFRQIRRRFDIDSADYMVTLCGDFNYIEFMSNSKSGQFFFYSHDGRFMIKTQTQDESKFLRRILPHYYKFVMENPNTLITRFYGMHRVKMHHLKKQMHFVIMASVFSTPKEIHLRFDLKGSKIGRNATPLEKSKNGVLKDNDLLEEHIHLSLGPEKRAMMLEQLRKDVAFLKRMKIMDYSLLIGIHDSNQDILSSVVPLVRPIPAINALPKEFKLKQFKHDHVPDIGDDNSDDEIEYSGVPLSPRTLETTNKTSSGGSIFCKDNGGICGRNSLRKKNGKIYFLGIIDILQQYNTRKITETVFKGFVHNKKDISSVPPDQYGDRFLDFIEKYVLVDEN